MFPFDEEKERLLSMEELDNKTTAMESNTNSDKMSGPRSAGEPSKYRLFHFNINKEVLTTN